MCNKIAEIAIHIGNNIEILLLFIITHLSPMTPIKMNLFLVYARANTNRILIYINMYIITERLCLLVKYKKKKIRKNIASVL